MKILVITHEGQGIRDNDFCFGYEFEPVRFDFVCTTPEKGSADGTCGCGRALIGMFSHKAGTTFKVMWSAFNVRQYSALILQSYRRAGYDRSWIHYILPSYFTSAMRIEQVAQKYRIGTIVEYRDGEFSERFIQS